MLGFLAAQPTFARLAFLHLLTGGIWSVIHEEIVNDRIATLPNLTPSATYIALAPFIGAGEAAEIARAG